MKPILFNTEMVRAILDGRKTTTRRVIKPQPMKKYCGGIITDSYKKSDIGKVVFSDEENMICGKPELVTKMPYKINDILYVRETWNENPAHDTNENFEGLPPKEQFAIYKATSPEFSGGWRPSIFMPKEAARIFLRVKGVRAERLQNITDEEAENEGCTDATSTAMGFFDVWDSTIKKSDRDKYGWNANPWVWVISFEQCKKPEDGK